MKKLILLLLIFINFTSCGIQWQYSTLNTAGYVDTIYRNSDISTDTISSVSELRWKLRNDFNFRYDFAQYALSQPSSFDWNNRILGNRYNYYSPYMGYNYYWNRDQMWNDWVWGFTPHRWSPFGYGMWGYNNWMGNAHYGFGWNNYYGWNGWYNNQWGWRNQMNDYAWQHRNRTNTAYINGPRSSSSIESRIIVNNSNRSRVVTNKPTIVPNKPRIVINNKPRINNSRPAFNNNSRPTFNNNSRPTFNNNSRPSTTVRTTPNRSTRSSSSTPTRVNSRKNN
jgi:hypothetical protein